MLAVMMVGQVVMLGATVIVVEVGLALPATEGSSVNTFAKFEPETVPCVLTAQVPAAIPVLMVARNLIVVLLPTGSVKPLPEPLTVTVSPDKMPSGEPPEGENSVILLMTASLFAGKLIKEQQVTR